MLIFMKSTKRNVFKIINFCRSNLRVQTQFCSEIENDKNCKSTITHLKLNNIYIHPLYTPSSTTNILPQNNIGIIEIHKTDALIKSILLPKSVFLSNSNNLGYSLQDTSLKFQFYNCESNKTSNKERMCGNLQRSLEWNLGEPLLMYDESNVSTLVGLYSTSNSKSIIFTNIKFYLQWIGKIINA